MNKYDIQWLRKSISVVNQQPILFETTVMENIRMGDENATDEQIIQLCQDLQIHQTIIKLSNVSCSLSLVLFHIFFFRMDIKQTSVKMVRI